jgi:hypothetical protein
MRLFGLRRQLAITVVIALGIVLTLPLLVDRMPPRSKTETNMVILKRAILDFTHRHGRMPRDLAELSSSSEAWDPRWTFDAYGNQIRYQSEANSEVSLLSLGKDGQPGGTGDDEDVIHSFKLKVALDLSPFR